MVAPSAPAPYPTRRRRVTLPRYQSSTSCLPWSAIMFLLLTGSPGTACAKFFVLIFLVFAKFVVWIVWVVVAEIKLALGQIAYTRKKISQERCCKCPLMGWSGRAPAPPAREAGKGRQRRGARHVTQAGIAVIG